jgi:hypothetical protein
MDFKCPELGRFFREHIPVYTTSNFDDNPPDQGEANWLKLGVSALNVQESAKSVHTEER